MDEPAFLSRIYDLEKLPSTDSRYRTAASDIYQHRVRNEDGEDDWVFGDPRFHLRNGTDESLLTFLAETVHPIVRPDSDEAASMVRSYNDILSAEGLELLAIDSIGGQAVYGWRERSSFHAASTTDIAMLPNLIESSVLSTHLRRINRDLTNDPPGAIAACKELIESQCKIILSSLGASFSDSEDLPRLFALVAVELKINADSVPGHARASEAVRKAMRTLTTTVQSITEARNSMGTGHGAEEDSPAEPRHARLVFNATVAVAEFVNDSWRVRADDESGL